MNELGLISKLPINRFTDFGAYLALSSGEEVLLPQGYLKGEEKEGDEVEVFVYTDSEDRPVAVTQKPKVLLDEFAVLEVKEVTSFGAFLDWGLPKDLLVPNSEMGKNMEVGEKYLVKVCLDYKTNRLIGVNKYRDFIRLSPLDWEAGKEVSGMIFEETDLGFKVLVENEFEGLLYKNEVFQPLEMGEVRKLFIKKNREDGKLDLQLLAPGRAKYDEGSEKILSILESKGFLALHDKSDPEAIKAELGMSKKHFKQCIGQLYKARMIQIQPDGISLNGSN
ncbi:S1-like domain-containing RNA-binding protein [Algoriphagus halophytocola]|uniref:S1-like domain-containing RNA-binding protein n=1 Tax=Algoriphagus halophytocola TaxID=2991499 RepID=A0ABY6MK80_9BACT|nr:MULTISPECIES: S1-like domain-containing RNA-binding protein [unclassified Algoriphagus]UZD23369.1 S1-like domain-containing RNA-binding protein [Algoriphagus sp. TR-M5]WBL44664.1 S1-like domain-containing RNA-binding protein [Algoriphagus sp. TR-M9]